MTNSEQLTALDTGEQETIGAAISKMLLSCPFIPGTIAARFEDMDAKPGQIGIFPQSGSVYLKRFVSGAFIGQYSFQLLYRVHSGADDKKRAEAENLLNALAEWIEGKSVTYDGTTYDAGDYPEMTDGRTILNLERTSTATLLGQRKDGSLDYSIYLTLEYIKK